MKREIYDLGQKKRVGFEFGKRQQCIVTGERSDPIYCSFYSIVFKDTYIAFDKLYSDKLSSLFKDKVPIINTITDEFINKFSAFEVMPELKDIVMFTLREHKSEIACIFNTYIKTTEIEHYLGLLTKMNEFYVEQNNK